MPSFRESGGETKVAKTPEDGEVRGEPGDQSSGQERRVRVRVLTATGLRHQRIPDDAGETSFLRTVRGP